MLCIPQCISHTPRVLKNGIKFAQNIPLNFANKYWSLYWSAAVEDAASLGLKESMSEKEKKTKKSMSEKEESKKKSMSKPFPQKSLASKN